jgi:hypothetical protein
MTEKQLKQLEKEYNRVELEISEQWEVLKKGKK